MRDSGTCGCPQVICKYTSTFIYSTNFCTNEILGEITGWKSEQKIFKGHVYGWFGCTRLRQPRSTGSSESNAINQNPITHAIKSHLKGRRAHHSGCNEMARTPRLLNL